LCSQRLPELHEVNFRADRKSNSFSVTAYSRRNI
jgi:hypothetical protein